MFVKNFYRMIMANNYYLDNRQQWLTIARVQRDTNTEFYSLNGNCYSYVNALKNFKILQPEKVYFGDSDIEPSLEQKSIQGNRITFTNESVRIFVSTKDDNKMAIGIQFKGTPENDGIIKEIALMKGIWQEDNNNPVGYFMIYRETIEPVEVTAGEEVEFLFEIDFDWA